MRLQVSALPPCLTPTLSVGQSSMECVKATLAKDLRKLEH